MWGRFSLLRDPRAAVLVPAVLATMHVAWGVGFLSSLVRGPRWLQAGRREARAVRTLIVNSTWVPDPSSTGQHFHDVAAALADRGHEVLVLTANRGYENPAERYPSRERRDGVVIRRLPLSSFGKSSVVARVVGGLSFVTQAAVHGLLSRRPDVVLVSTAPPFCSAAALAVSWLRGAPVLFWVHDLNPDLSIALGLLREGSLAVRLLNLLNRGVLGLAQRIVVLDRFMMERIERRLDVASKTLILPPWPHVDADERIAHADNPWRRKHVGRGRRVVMFSGNHSPAHPLDTLLQAALQLQDDTAIEFLFVGGGTDKRKIEATIERERPPNIRCLPYQPLATLRYSLAAADVQVVAVGDRSVGISHPCKIYGALAVGRPILLFGPRSCHATDIMGTHDVGWRVTNGDVDGAVEALRDIQTTPAERLDEMGRTAQQLVRQSYSRDALTHRFCDEVEALLPDFADVRPAMQGDN